MWYGYEVMQYDYEAHVFLNRPCGHVAWPQSHLGKVKVNPAVVTLSQAPTAILGEATEEQWLWSNCPTATMSPVAVSVNTDSCCHVLSLYFWELAFTVQPQRNGIPSAQPLSELKSHSPTKALWSILFCA